MHRTQANELSVTRRQLTNGRIGGIHQAPVPSATVAVVWSKTEGGPGLGRSGGVG